LSPTRFTKAGFAKICRDLGKKHPVIASILKTYGIPPMYQRPFGFETLVKIILEQQVSLASARAAFNKLESKLGKITPQNILAHDTGALRACSVSRQKASYLHHLSQMVASGSIIFETLAEAPDEEVKHQLMQVKGIGPWTAEVVLMLCLQRPDLFPVGDVALVNSVRLLNETPEWTLKEVETLGEQYAPYRTIAAYCYWHAYIQRKNIAY
jgi:DNA-3-methyladenine glycosylase II